MGRSRDVKFKCGLPNTLPDTVRVCACCQLSVGIWPAVQPGTCQAMKSGDNRPGRELLVSKDPRNSQDFFCALELSCESVIAC